MKPLLPDVDAAGLLREAARSATSTGRPSRSRRAKPGTTGIDIEAARTAVNALAQTGWLDLEDSGRVVGAAGLSLATGPHRLTIGEAPFRTWCAYDALGIAAALRADARIETTCGQCQAPISLAFRGGIPEPSGPEQLWLADGGPDLRGSFCLPTVLLCGEEHGTAWAEAQGGRGGLLDVLDAARQGGAGWAGCAEVARRLS
jgi:alkylmercury lyase